MFTCQDTEYCKVLIQYESDNATIQQKKTEVMNKFKDLKIPGYRPGHTTIAAISQHYRKEIHEELKRELAAEAVQNVIAEKDIKPFGQPIFNNVNLNESKIVGLDGQPSLPKFNCEFVLHTQPEFTLNTYKSFEIPKASGIMPTEELTQRILQDLRIKHGNTVPYDENSFIQDGDTIIVDFSAAENGKPIDSLIGIGQILNVGRINIPGFSENLLGMKISESRDFELVMPPEYANDLGGKTLHFEVKLNMGSKNEPSPLNDELALKIGIESFDKLMDNVRSTASARVKELEQNHITDQVSRRLIESHDFKIPSWISSAEAEINSKNAGQDWTTLSDDDKAKAVNMADGSIKLSLILQKIRDNEPDAQLTEEEVFKQTRENIARYSHEPDKVIQELYKNGHLGLLFNRVRDDHTLATIAKTCTVIE